MAKQAETKIKNYEQIGLPPQEEKQSIEENIELPVNDVPIEGFEQLGLPSTESKLIPEEIEKDFINNRPLSKFGSPTEYFNQLQLPEPKEEETPFEKVNEQWFLTKDIYAKFAKNKSGFRLGADGIISAKSSNMVNFDAVINANGTADYPDLQGAIDAGAKRIFIRNGTYTLTKDITFNSNTVLVGESKMDVVFEGNYQFYIDGGGVYFSNFTKKSTAVDITFYHFDFNGMSYGGLDNININASSILAGKNTNGVKLTNGNQVFITNCVFFCYNIAINNDSNSDNNKVTNSYIYGGIVLDGTNNSFINNLVTIVTSSSITADNHGIDCKGNYGVISDNNISFSGEGPTKYGVYLQNEYNSVNNNLIKGFKNNVFVDSIGENCIISNNRVESSLEDAIVLTSTKQNIVSNNLLIDNCRKTNNIYAQIKLYDNGLPAIYNTMVGNVFYSDEANKHKYSINEDDATCDNNLIVGNSFKDAVTSELRIQGVNTEAKNNKGTPSLDERKIIKMENTSGGSVAAGDVVVLKAAAGGNEFTTTTNQGDDLVLGMATETIADNATGNILISGKTLALKVDGTTDIAIGDFIGTFTTAKIGMKAAAGDMAIAIALEAYTTDDSSGVIDALLITPRKI